jgi:hypothetical protein
LLRLRVIIAIISLFLHSRKPSCVLGDFSIKYNAYMPEDAMPKSLITGREAMLQEIDRRLGKNSYAEPPFFIDYGCNISIDSDFYANFKCIQRSCLFGY